ncbi:uncharacterized protein LOC118437689 [Folsomia candida]|uniref:Secreted protein n=1 Tax=Folsomia candida TaxID=158441 RepID=A0A226DNE2_FOLCA|nr:uncharacterized protein LOC118437689 [Folsomia candida]OXA46518.1 hypothetical protein Fcan01_18763 [Folsomia candida]
MFLTIFSLSLFSDFVHSENKSFNFTSFCTCPSSGKLYKPYCGHEISTTNPDCMTHAIYECINGPNKVAIVTQYCKNSRCGQVGVGNRFTPDCLDPQKGKYFKDIESGKTAKYEGCWFPKREDGYKYADRTFYYDTRKDDDTLFHIYRRTGGNEWVNTTFRQ